MSQFKRNPTMDKLVKVINNSDKFKFENAAKTLDAALHNRRKIMNHMEILNHGDEVEFISPDDGSIHLGIIDFELFDSISITESITAETYVVRRKDIVRVVKSSIPE